MMSTRNKTATLATGLFVAVIVSSIAVVYARYESRRLFIELQRHAVIRDELNVDWGRLQIERSTWATLARVEKLADEKLEMQVPDPATVMIVEP
jgi:cell division protein FtsL